MTSITREEGHDGRDLFFHKETELTFNAIVGGIAWPAERPGFACIVGQVASLHPPFRYHLMAEIEEHDLTKLLRHSAELVLDHMSKAIYGRYDDSCMQFLNLLNRDNADQGKSGFFISEAPFSDKGAIGYHVNVLKGLLAPNNKSLFLSDNSKLPGYLMEIPAGDIVSVNDSQYPAVAALGYAVSALVLCYSRPVILDRKIKTFNVIDRLKGKE